MDTKKVKLAVGAIIATTAAVGGILIMSTDGVRSKVSSGSLTGVVESGQMENGEKPVEHKMPAPYRNEAERQLWVQRNRHFAELWIARHERDVTDEIAVFLDDPDPSLRERAARALGRLESPDSEAPLQAKLKRVQEAKEKQQRVERHISETTLKLALGRSRARGLKGEAKLNQMAKGVGLSFDNVVQLAQNLKKQLEDKNANVRQEAIASQEFQVLLEFVDALYVMGKRGENIQAFGSDSLAIAPGLQARLKAATLSLDEEIDEILDYATEQGKPFDESYSVGLGPRATEMLIQRLQDIQQSPQRDRLGWGCVSLFRAAAMTGDSRVAPLLEQFRKSKDPVVSSFAAQTLDLMEQGIFPAVPA